MTTRTKRETVVFLHSFLLKGIGRARPVGNYEVLIDEELIEGLSFPVYLRVSIMMLAPSPLTSAVEMLTIDPSELRAVGTWPPRQAQAGTKIRRDAADCMKTLAPRCNNEAESNNRRVEHRRRCGL